MSYLSEEFSDFDRYLGLEAFTEGRSFGAWKLFGAHPDVQNGTEGYRFFLWAPNAKNVAVMGDFNQWNDCSHPMTRLEGGLWESFVPDLQQYDSYKYAIHTHDGRVIPKADPYAFHSETRPATASKLYHIGQYTWNDQSWLDYKSQMSPYDSPMNVYECHLGSWRRGGEGEFLDYRSIAQLLVPYVKEMGYTHVEMMPVMEHPLDASWGYQVTGYFSPTSRFGTPDDLKYLIDQLHQAGIGVILDWVPAHFPRDEYGLFQFDGTATYEYQDPIMGEHPQWGTNCFDLGRMEVRSFLFSSAMYWLEEFHADGLRVDAVSSMLYLNFGREDAPWLPNIYGGQENLEAISFLRELNTNIFQKFPHVLMIAEEATSWPQVTHPVAEGGLGFNFKWNMGWMNDICHYIKLDPLERQHHHKDLTFAMMYAFNENYILPMSHDEVVHMKSSYLGKMAGDTFQKLASSRAFYLYIITHPGKKLSFMGAEFGQWNEWTEEHSLDWHLLEYPDHQNIQNFHKEANKLYLASPSLWERDCSWDGFLWLCADDNLGNTLCYARWDNKGNPLVVVCNFSPVHRDGYRVPLPMAGRWTERFSTDWAEFGGSNIRNQGHLEAQMESCYGQPQSMAINLPPNATLVFSYVDQESKPNNGLVLEEMDKKKVTIEKVETAPKRVKNPEREKKLGESLIIGEIVDDTQKRNKKKKMVEEVLGISSKEEKPKKKVGRPKKIVDEPIIEIPKKRGKVTKKILDNSPEK
ncbi:MAG: 1,4-alpha-glucan branching protein GlgB [Eubacteriales bacterium]